MTDVVLCTLGLPEPAPSRLEARAELRTLGDIPASERLCDEVAKGVAVLCSQLRDRVSADVLEAGSDLVAVCNYAVGFDNVDVAAATERGIVVTNTPEVLTEATADCAMGLLLATARRLCEGDRVVRMGAFKGWEPTYLLGTDVSGQRLGLVGFGRIGQAVARRASEGFGMDVVYFDPSRPVNSSELPGRPVALDELLATSDFVSLHAPSTSETRHLIDGEALRAMKSSAVLVNTARGDLVDEQALAVALKAGWIWGAGLDVYENEPHVSADLIGCENVVLAPHLGSATVQTRARMAEVCAENAVAALDGRMPPNALNPEAWDRARGA